MDVHRPEDPGARWHVDLTINIPVMIGFLTAFSSFVWFAANSSARIDSLEKQMALYGPIHERLIRVEYQVKAIDGTVLDIKAILNTRRP